MKKIWNTFLELFFLNLHFEFDTKLTPKRIFRWVELFANDYSSDYDVWLDDDGFIIKEKWVKSFIIGSVKNSLVPIAIAKLMTIDDKTTISVTIRLNRIKQALNVCLYSFILFMSFFSFEAFGFLLIFSLFTAFGFLRPARRLKKRLIFYLSEN